MNPTKVAPAKMHRFIADQLNDLAVHGKVLSVSVQESAYLVMLSLADRGITFRQLSPFDVGRSLRGDLDALAVIRADPLSANMDETVPPLKFSVEGESGLESDARIGAGPQRAGDRGGGEGDTAAVHGGVQAGDRPGGGRLQDTGRDRGVAAA